MLKTSKIIIICITILSSIVGFLTVYKIEGNKNEVEQQFVYDQRWVSEDHTYSVNIPKSWKLMRIESIIAQDCATGTLVSASIPEDEKQSGYKTITSKNLLNMAINNVMLISEDRCILLETHVGFIGKYPSAWLLARSDEEQAEPMNYMIFAFNTSNGVYMMEFMMIPNKSLMVIRPIIEDIARSFRLLGEKQAYSDKNKAGSLK